MRKIRRAAWRIAALPFRIVAEVAGADPLLLRRCPGVDGTPGTYDGRRKTEILRIREV